MLFTSDRCGVFVRVRRPLLPASASTISRESSGSGHTAHGIGLANPASNGVAGLARWVSASVVGGTERWHRVVASHDSDDVV